MFWEYHFVPNNDIFVSPNWLRFYRQSWVLRWQKMTFWDLAQKGQIFWIGKSWASKPNHAGVYRVITFIFWGRGDLGFWPCDIASLSDVLHQRPSENCSMVAYLDGVLEDGLVSGLEGEAEAAVHLPQHHPELSHQSLASIWGQNKFTNKQKNTYRENV